MLRIKTELKNNHNQVMPGSVSLRENKFFLPLIIVGRKNLPKLCLGEPGIKDTKNSPPTKPIITNNRLSRNKKGISVWIAWVLVMMLAVILGTFYFTWMKGYTTETVYDMQERSEYITICESTGLWVKNICQNTQTLNMNITNSKDLKIDEVMVRITDVYGDPKVSTRNITVWPGKTESMDMLKQEITKQIEVIPVIYKDKKRIVCSSRTTTISSIPFC